jgi:hypothetical protein
MRLLPPDCSIIPAILRRLLIILAPLAVASFLPIWTVWRDVSPGRHVGSNSGTFFDAVAGFPARVGSVGAFRAIIWFHSRTVMLLGVFLAAGIAIDLIWWWTRKRRSPQAQGFELKGTPSN